MRASVTPTASAGASRPSGAIVAPARGRLLAHRARLALACAIAACAIAGCAVTGAARDPLPDGRFARAFEAAQRALIDHGFVLDRIDARAGVLTTRPKASPGLFLPADREQRTARQELEDTLHTQRRVVRVTIPRRDDAAPGGAAMTVEVVLERSNRPGTRIETEAVGLTSRYTSASFEQGEMLVPVRRDVAFERYLERRIAGRIENAGGR